jgi:hypothetical protein
MPVFLDTRGNPTLGIGLCGRCSRKFPLHELQSDPNFPGLMVCRVDRDDFDPYRLPARQPEKITLPFVRTDAPIGTNPAGLIGQDGDVFLITEDGEEYLEP